MNEKSQITKEKQYSEERDGGRALGPTKEGEVQHKSKGNHKHQRKTVQSPSGD
jgi:hypothetical protein